VARSGVGGKVKSGLAWFWSELKRRRVLKTTIAYVVGAWVLVEVSSVVFPALLAPEWAVRVLIAGAILALPFVVVLAWVFDLERKPGDIVESNRVGQTNSDNDREYEPGKLPPVPDTAVASVAVLPFANLSSDTEHQFIADGIATELHSTLARVHRLRVASRSSSFAISNSDTEIESIAHKLNVQFVISGSLQCLGDRIHVIAGLDNAVEGVQIWSETYDRELGDLFSVQHDIAYAIASEFGGARLKDEIANAAKRPTASLDAWSRVQRARSYLLGFTPRALTGAVPLLRQAIDLDSNYAAAHATLASVLAEEVLNGLSVDIESDSTEAIDSADRAFALSPVDPFVLKMCGVVWAYIGRTDASIGALRRAVSAAPFDFGAWGYMGWPLVETGAPEDLVELHEIMERISAATPHHPGVGYWLYHRSVAFTCDGRKELAMEYAKKSIDCNPRFPWGWMHYANVLGLAGFDDKARRAKEKCMEVSPALSPEHYQRVILGMSRQEAFFDSRLNGLKSSGLLS